jgi:hypothetical protein
MLWSKRLAGRQTATVAAGTPLTTAKYVSSPALIHSSFADPSGAQFKKSEGGKKVVYAPGALPSKKSLSDLP